MVSKQWWNGEGFVALKVMLGKPECALESLVDEISYLFGVMHPHIVSWIGLCPHLPRHVFPLLLPLSPGLALQSFSPIRSPPPMCAGVCFPSSGQQLTF